MSTKKPQTYQQALKSPSRLIWSGCGDGRKRWCGGIHDYGYRRGDGKYLHDFRCSHNHRIGCPMPIPDPKETREEWEKRQKE